MNEKEPTAYLCNDCAQWSNFVYIFPSTWREDEHGYHCVCTKKAKPRAKKRIDTTKNLEQEDLKNDN